MNDTVVKYKVNRALVTQLYKRFDAVLNAESLATVVMIVLLWNSINHWLLLMWFMLSIAMNAIARLISALFHYYEKSKAIKNISIWKILFVATVFGGGLVWAIGGIIFFADSANEESKLLIILMLTSIVGAANAQLFHNKISYLMFVGPIYLALLYITYLAENPIFKIIFVGVLIYITFTTTVALKSSTAMFKTLQMQFRNKQLQKKVLEAKQKLEEANIELEKEIHIRKVAEKLLMDLATHDHLTKLANRNLLQDRLEESIYLAKQNRTLLALFFIDLDNFKAINDTYGHIVGDKLLIKVSAEISKSIGALDLLARFGGDEFCLIVDAVSDIQVIKNIAENICHSLSKPFNIEQHSIFVTASVGIAIYPDDSSDIHSLFKNADIALYWSKQSGKNTYRFFNAYELNG